MILNDLTEIEWGRLSLVSGDATEMPYWIIGLTSLDAGIRSESFKRLRQNIYHQGDVSEITVHVVPFLIQVLTITSLDIRVKILGFLGTLASVIGSEQYRLEHPLPPEEQEYLARIGYGRDPKISRQYEVETYAAVKKAVP